MCIQERRRIIIKTLPFHMPFQTHCKGIRPPQFLAKELGGCRQDRGGPLDTVSRTRVHSRHCSVLVVMLSNEYIY
jgi:hypothetical protein